MNSNRNVWIALVVIGIIAIAGLFSPTAQSLVKSFAGVTNYDEVDVTALKVGGSSGSRLGPIIEGTCALTPAQASITASTTAVADCAVTGVVSGDNVIAQFATSTASSPQFGATSSGWIITAASASTTSGFITVRVLNQTGGNAVLSASGIASSTVYHISHPVTSVPGL